MMEIRDTSLVRIISSIVNRVLITPLILSLGLEKSKVTVQT